MIKDLKPEQHSPIDAAYKEFYLDYETRGKSGAPGIITGYHPHDAFIHYASQQYGFNLMPRDARQSSWNIEIVDEKKYMMFLLQWA